MVTPGSTNDHAPSPSIRCGHCGSENTDQQFCDNCGHALDAAPPVPLITAGAVFQVAGDRLEIVRREIDGDWTARSDSDRYYLVSTWPASEDSTSTRDEDGAAVNDPGRPGDTAIDPGEKLGADDAAGAPDSDDVRDADDAGSAVGDADPDAHGVASDSTATAPEPDVEPATLWASSTLASSTADGVLDEPAADPPAHEEALPAREDPVGDERALDPMETTEVDDAVVTLDESESGRDPGLETVLELLATVHHPSLPETHLLGRHPEEPVDLLFLEYNPDGEWLSSMQPSEALTCRVAGQLAQLLDSAHASGLVLLGLRPESVRWSETTERASLPRLDGTSRLSDPGVPRTWGPTTAPEVTRGEAPTVAADAYSLGLTIASALEMLDGDEVVTGFVPAEELDPELMALIMRCAAAVPDARATLAEIARELGALRAAVSVDSGTVSSVGAVRHAQQDMWATLAWQGNATLPGTVVLVVADGMGGMRAGDMASRIAVRTLLTELSTVLPVVPEQLPQSSLEERLAIAYASATDAITKHAAASAIEGEMGTTMTTAVVVGKRLTVAHVGDSRCYLVRGGDVRQITVDHTVVARLVEIGELTPEEAVGHPQSSTLYKSLGSGRPVQPDVTSISLEDGDWLVLCSDGVHGLIPHEDLAAVADADTPEDAARNLVTRALQMGGTDNATAICARITARLKEGDRRNDANS